MKHAPPAHPLLRFLPTRALGLLVALELILAPSSGWALSTVTVKTGDAIAGEENTPYGYGTFIITRSGDLDADLEVFYNYGGTATWKVDYYSLDEGSVLFIPGQSSYTIGIEVQDDSYMEGNETVVLQLLPHSGYIVGSPAQATVTIRDDEVVTVKATDTTAGEPGTSYGTGTFTFTRTGSTASPLTVNFTLSGTATPVSDYEALGTTVIFPPGSSTVTLDVVAKTDNEMEGDEKVTLILAAAVNYTLGSAKSATVTIKSAEVVTVAATDATAGEPGGSGNSGTFTFTRTGSTASPLTVSFTVSGTAIKDSDYDYAGYLVPPLTFVAGQASVTRTVNVKDDTMVEPDETVIVTLATGNGYTLGTAKSATVTIKDDDKNTISVVASDSLASEPRLGEGTGAFTFTRSGSAAAPLTVSFTVSGTATKDSDYIYTGDLGTSVTFPAGASSVTKTVTVKEDALVEVDETIIVTLAANTAYLVNASAKTATVTIKDDDSSTTYVMGATLGGKVNDWYTGYYGMIFKVDGSPILVTDLGRIFVAGNSGTHVLKIVNPNNNNAISASLPMAGGTADKFKYAKLSRPVSLGADTVYYLVSSETQGGDYFYEGYGTSVDTTTVATELGHVWQGSDAIWHTYGIAGTTWGPLDFKYSTAAILTGGEVELQSLDECVTVNLQMSDQLSIPMHGEPGQRCVVESSTDLVEWTVVSPILQPGQEIDLLDGTPESDSIYYRLSPASETVEK